MEEHFFDVLGLAEIQKTIFRIYTTVTIYSNDKLGMIIVQGGADSSVGWN